MVDEEEKGESDSSLQVPSDRRRGSRPRMEHRKFYLNVRKKCFTCQWHRLSRVVVETPSFEIRDS